jgi:hypothetical protein
MDSLHTSWSVRWGKSTWASLDSMCSHTLIRACYMCAAITKDLPPMPPSPALNDVPASTYERILSGSDPHLLDIGKGLLKPEVAQLFSPKMIEIIQCLRSFILYQEYCHDEERNFPAEEEEFFLTRNWKFRYMALSIPTDRHQGGRNDRQEPCRLALLTFSYANYITQQPDSALFRSLTMQLKTALEESVDLRFFWHPYSEVLMWVLYLGAYISKGQRERPWFIVHLSRGARLLKIKDWNEMRTILMQYFYIDRIYLRRYLEVWEEMRMLMDGMVIGWSA